MLHCAVLLLGRSRPGPAVFSSRSFTTAGADRMIVGGIAGKSLVVPFVFFLKHAFLPSIDHLMARIPVYTCERR